MTRIAIIGAGIAGLTLARQLRDYASVTVFEKSSGVGGRMATRAAPPYSFDHGAQFFTAKSPEFRREVDEWVQRGVARSWNVRFAEFEHDRVVAMRDWDDEKPHYVGAPGMNQIGKHLAADIEVRLNTTVAPAVRADDSWRLDSTDGEELGRFDWVVATAPAAQTAALLPASFAHHSAVAAAPMQGCYALMLGFTADAAPAPAWQVALVREADISWISVNSSKPDRGEACSILVHSTNAFADAHMDADMDSVKAHLVQEFSNVTGIATDMAKHCELHRWRYANTPQQSGDPALLDPQQQLGACGDWLIHGRIEAAFLSATAMAKAIDKALR